MKQPAALTLLLLLAAPLLSAATLKDRIQAITRTVDGRVGVAVRHLERAEEIQVDGFGKYPMQSVYKFPIAMHVLSLVDRGTLRLDQEVAITPDDLVSGAQHSPIRDLYPRGTTATLRELLRLNVAESDGTACDVLLRLAGGPQAVMKFLASIGVNEVTVVDTEKALGAERALQYRNYATPLGAIGLLRAFHEGRGLTPASRALLQRFMIETGTGMKRLKGDLPADTIVAHKTGTSDSRGGRTAATNDIGILTLPNGGHVAIAVFVSDASGNAAEREGVIARIGRAVYDEYAQAAFDDK